jgi:N-acyl-D-aspartate/D-glutamate deacylase
MHDLVIKGGTVVDGTGAEPRRADVAIAGGTIAEVGPDLGAARRQIDADGLLVTPGWVDVHTHYDAQVMWDSLLAPSSRHGVTTVVMGNCGVGFAPVHPDGHEWLISLMEGVEDIPAAVLGQGLPWGWESFAEYLDAVDRIPHAIDVAAQVPHAALRVYVMGERGSDHTEAATAEEIARMGELAADAIRAGAVGFSTSRSRNHRAADGRFTPTLTAATEELVGIADAIGRTGRGVFEVVFDGDDLDADFSLLRRMCEISHRPMSVTTLQRMGQPPTAYRGILTRIERAVADGLVMRGQVAARPVGLLMSLDSRMQPLAGSTTYQSLMPLPREDRLAALARPDVRARVLEEASVGDNPISRFPDTFDLGVPPRWDRDPDESIAAQAAQRGVRPIDVAYDILAAGGTIYAPAADFVEGDYRAVREMLVHPLTVPGLGDAGAHCTMIADFDFPTYLLAYWARDADPEVRLPVEWVVRRQCAETAALVGMSDRGMLCAGMKADVNIIDLEHLATSPATMVKDLPAGGSRLFGTPRGYVATIAGGQVTFEDGEHTGALPGRLVRSQGPR